MATGKHPFSKNLKTDNVSPEVRSAIMANIRGRGTSIEARFARELRRRGVRFKQHLPWLGSPDFAFPGAGVVIFLDSCFWHRCPYHFRMPSSRRDYWPNKILQNVVRDRQIRADYRKMKWKVLRFWEHSIANDLNACIDKTADALKSGKHGLTPPPRRVILRGCVRFKNG
jgi:DNA mismatch endonuclease (patch repair protein)